LLRAALRAALNKKFGSIQRKALYNNLAIQYNNSAHFLNPNVHIAFLSLVQYRFSDESRAPCGSHLKICGLTERGALYRLHA
jgi:hypothetical protein